MPAEQDAVLHDGTTISSRETREHACALAAEVCRGQMPTGTTLLSYIILFETFLVQGGDETANVMGWDVVEKAPVSLAEARARIKEVME